MKILPIKSEADYDRALEAIDKLWGSEPGTAKGDQLDVLLVLVDDYEQKHHPIAPPDPVEAIKFRMEQMSLSRKDLEPIIGSRGRVTEVINGQRPLSLAMIRRLHQTLRIPLESLIRGADESVPSPKRKPAPRSAQPRRSSRAAA